MNISYFRQEEEQKKSNEVISLSETAGFIYMHAERQRMFMN